MLIVGSGGERFTIVGRRVLSTHISRTLPRQDRIMLSAVHLRDTIKSHNVQSIDEHAPELREVLDLFLWCESIIMQG